MSRHNHLANGQSQSGTTTLRGVRGLHLFESLKYLFSKLPWHSSTRIRNFDLQLLSKQLGRDCYLSAWVRKLYGVGNQIDQYLLEPVFVTPSGHVNAFDNYLDLLLLQQHLEGSNGFFNQLSKFEGGTV